MGGKGSGDKPKTLFALATDREPYDQQPGETFKAFAAFAVYRDFGPNRTIKKVREHLKKRAGLCEQWSSAYAWPHRATEWDRTEDRHRREASLQAAEDRAREKVMVADLMWETAAEALILWNMKLKQQAKLAEENPDDLPTPCMVPNHARQLAEAGLKLSQLLEGKPTEIGEERKQITVDDRRREIRSILGDERVRRAMKIVSDATNEKTKDNGSGDGSNGAEDAGAAVH